MNFVEYVIINIDQLESRDRTSVKKIAAQSNKGCGCFSRKHKKSVACVNTDEHGLKKLKCSCVQILWVAHLIIALSGDVEENPGPFTQINNDKNAPCANKSIQFHYWNPW